MSSTYIGTPPHQLIIDRHGETWIQSPANLRFKGTVPEILAGCKTEAEHAAVLLAKDLQDLWQHVN